MFPLGTHFGAAPEGLLLLFMAMAVDAALGDMPWLFRHVPHPVVIIGRLIGRLDRRLNRAALSESDRRVRGVVLVLLVVGSSAVIGALIAFLARTIPHLWIAEVLLTAVLLAQRGLFEHVNDVARALQKNGLEAGRFAVSRIVGRDPTTLDAHGVARAAIESLAENFSDAVVAPVFWYALFGLPGILAYKAANTLDSMVGYRNETYLAFGWASARLDDALNLIPARLSGVIIACAALFAARGHPVAAWRGMMRDARNHRSPNSGWPEAAMAGALDLALGGPRRYPGGVVETHWIGRGRTDATVPDIDRALHVFTVACVLDVGWVIGLLWLQS